MDSITKRENIGGEVTFEGHCVSKVTPAKETEMFLVWPMLPFAYPYNPRLLKGYDLVYIYINTYIYVHASVGRARELACHML